jgi:hypothetical protein
MSATINLSPLIGKVIRDLIEQDAKSLDIETVYTRLNEVYGDDIFQSERMLAQIAVRGKIKAHLKSAFSINGEEGDDQLRLLKEDAPAALAVKQPGGGFAYVPLRMAGIQDVDAATKSKRDNIKNARASLKRWEDAVKPVRAVMQERGVTFGEAQKLLAEQQKTKPTRKASA